jgi:GTPase KRas protein
MSEIKLVILGSGGVGKSAVTIQFLQHHFIEIYDPTIEDAYRKQICVDNKTYLVEIMDTAGQEDYSALRDQYYRYGEGFALLFDLTKRTTFNEIAYFRDQIYECKRRETNDPIPIVLIGNKCDLNLSRQVSYQEANYLSNILGCKYFECSAKTNYNVDAPWIALLKEVIQLRNKKINSPKSKNKCTLL